MSFFYNNSYADFQNNPEAVPGWTHEQDLENDVPGKYGIILPGKKNLTSSPVIADVDGNGSLEVLVANTRAVVIFNGYDGAPLSCQEKVCNPNRPFIPFLHLAF